MKIIFKKHWFTKLFFFVITLFAITGCEELYENHDIVACGVNDPLQNIEWLEKYCNNIKEKKDYSNVSIDLYKGIDTNEQIFFIKYSNENRHSISTHLNCVNCNGDTIFRHAWMAGKGDFSPMNPDPAPYDEFMKDKEFVFKLYYFVK